MGNWLRKFGFVLLAGSLLSLGAEALAEVDIAALTETTPKENWGALNAHDPAIFKDGEWYYAFSTDASLGNVHRPGVQVRRSADLINWTYLGTAFADLYNDCQSAVAYAKLDLAKNQGLWAPDVVKFKDGYRMYYSASTFGSSQSAIGLAESKNAEGPYVDKGIVIKSYANALTAPNAIDPSIIRDKNGQLYLSYGSFFGGIWICALDMETGFLREGAEPVRLAGSRHAPVEGSVIVYLEQTDMYYMFVSYGSLSKDYNVRVARSHEITGPYEDATGQPMTNLAIGNEERVGTKILGGYAFSEGGFYAPGHNSVLVDGDALYIVHHTRIVGQPHYRFLMQVRRMMLNENGWPMVMPMVYQGETQKSVNPLPEGEYELIFLGVDNNAEPKESVPVTLGNGIVAGSAVGDYALTAEGHVHLNLQGVFYTGEALWQNADTLMISAMSENGQCVWLRYQGK